MNHRCRNRPLKGDRGFPHRSSHATRSGPCGSTDKESNRAYGTSLLLAQRRPSAAIFLRESFVERTAHDSIPIAGAVPAVQSNQLYPKCREGPS